MQRKFVVFISRNKKKTYLKLFWWGGLWQTCLSDVTTNQLILCWSRFHIFLPILKENLDVFRASWYFIKHSINTKLFVILMIVLVCFEFSLLFMSSNYLLAIIYNHGVLCKAYLSDRIFIMLWIWPILSKHLPLSELTQMLPLNPFYSVVRFFWKFTMVLTINVNSVRL